MKQKSKLSQSTSAKLRRRAERQLRIKAGKKLPRPTPVDAERLLHELQVHQVELEMQNVELQRAHTEIQAALEKVTSLYDFAPVSYVTLDRDGKIQDANLAASALFGVARSALANRGLALFFRPSDRTSFDRFLAEVFSGGSRGRCEVTLLAKGKPSFPAELDATMAEGGKLCRVVMSDITERKRLEEARLILSKLESTGVLAGGIAHDFNNLLATISLGLDLALRSVSSNRPLRDCLNDVKQAVCSAQHLTQQFLIFSEGGDPMIKRGALPDVLRDSTRLALTGSSVRSEFHVPVDLPPVIIDVNQISRVVYNLVLNAKEAMPCDGLITIVAEDFSNHDGQLRDLPPGRYVRTSITDQGVGISPENLARVFDPYFSTKQRGKEKGMGLGLTVCHTIIKKHGGMFSVRSKLNVGTTMEFYLPAAEPVGELAATAGRAAEISAR